MAKKKENNNNCHLNIEIFYFYSKTLKNICIHVYNIEVDKQWNMMTNISIIKYMCAYVYKIYFKNT